MTAMYSPHSTFHSQTSSNFSHTMNDSRKSRSFLGSIKDKISRRPSNASQRSVSSRGGASLNPFTAQSVAEPRNEPPPPPPYAEQAPVAPVTAAGSSQRRDPSPTPSRMTRGSRIQAQDVSTPEDPFAFLATFDTVFLIDDSGSMVGQRWREVDTLLRSITPICTSHDTDGVDVYFLNHRSSDVGDVAHGRAAAGYNVKDGLQVENIFRRAFPCGGTPTGSRLRDILIPYVRHFEKRVKACDDDAWDTGVKPINLIVITDGRPSDSPEDILIDVARRLDRVGAPAYQVGVQFFQVGNDQTASEALAHLDDELGPSHGVRDMIDTVSWNARDAGEKTLTASAVLKTILGAVKRHVDRQDVSEEMSSGSQALLSSRRW